MAVAPTNSNDIADPPAASGAMSTDLLMAKSSEPSSNAILKRKVPKLSQPPERNTPAGKSKKTYNAFLDLPKTNEYRVEVDRVNGLWYK